MHDAFLDHDEAVAEGVKRDIGRVEVIGPGPERLVAAASFTSFTFKYTTGNTPILPCGFVWFATRHVFQATPPQKTNPAAPDFVSIQISSNAVLEVINWPVRPDGEDVFLRAFPWQHPIEIRVKEGRL